MSPDGEAIVTGAGDETLRFWNVFSKTRCTKVGPQTDRQTGQRCPGRPGQPVMFQGPFVTSRWAEFNRSLSLSLSLSFFVNPGGFLSFPKVADKPKVLTFVCKHCWREFWPEFASVKLSSVIWPELEDLNWGRRFLSVPRSQSQCWTSSPGYGSECLSALPEENHWVALQTHTHNHPPSSPQPPPTPPGSLLPSFNSDVAHLKATCLFIFSVVRPFFLIIIIIMTIMYWQRRMSQRAQSNVYVPTSQLLKRKSLICKREDKEDCRLGWCACQASFYILIMCKYDDDTI